ncbi:hypothetical protein EJ02DRAFT_121994 [Clathrospora elynae]|uniref:Uncharacterized protein n=1 Tax=Clathrospora elynae TaxID=706981 RepID=A0A6A5SVE3_9PLEO|nr:hypothetical protein EJ02DRAFT_121994 [Clathrospora elynae]
MSIQRASVFDVKEFFWRCIRLAVLIVISLILPMSCVYVDGVMCRDGECRQGGASRMYACKVSTTHNSEQPGVCRTRCWWTKESRSVRGHFVLRRHPRSYITVFPPP